MEDIRRIKEEEIMNLAEIMTKLEIKGKLCCCRDGNIIVGGNNICNEPLWSLDGKYIKLTFEILEEEKATCPFDNKFKEHCDECSEGE